MFVDLCPPCLCMAMLPTPSTSHVNPNRIYEPAEDSYLLLDTLSSPAETQFLTRRFGGQCTPGYNEPNPSPIVLEVGTGSGVVLAFITAHAKAILGRYDVVALGSDVNEHACQATKETVSHAIEDSNRDLNTAAGSKLLAALCADLTSPLRSGVADVVIFNPPYVPSPDVPGILDMKTAGAALDDAGYDAKYKLGSLEYDSHLLSLSYAGGVDGMEVTNRMLEELPSALNNTRGVAYILLSQQNKPAEVIQQIREWGPGWDVEVVGTSGKKAGWEKLQIIRIWRV